MWRWIASVIGYHFDLPTLVEVFPAGGNQKKFLKGELDVLVRLQIIKVTSLMPGSEAYRFVNPSFLEVRSLSSIRFLVFSFSLYDRWFMTD